MKAEVVFLVLLVGLLSSRAEDSKVRADTQTSPKSSTQWDTSADHWDRVLSQSRDSSSIRLGRSDFVVTGPLVGGFSRQQFSSDLSRGQKFLTFPIVRWFVPRRMASPPGSTGRYFAWGGESDRPWAAVAAGSPPGAAFNPIDNEPKTALISVHY